eukprot:TRINITY_DN23716_c0_g1_i1.p1 TRINITY_DN23716_c0_g1~~TRINITY_DN23716_c0_g1_i1.p1  ORF type:complete len:851 (+),score=222.46 TRINITY_DN23716_c0_g1_i1:59-2611(+)
MIPVVQPPVDPLKYLGGLGGKDDDSSLRAQPKTWGAATSDALSGRYTAVADDEQQSANRREAAMLFAVAEGHVNDNEDYAAAEQTASQALSMFKEQGDLDGVSDSLRVVVDAMRLQAGRDLKRPVEAKRLASEELAWFKQEGHKRGQASMSLALARVSTSPKMGSKDRDHGVKQGKEAVKIYRELGDKPMEGAALLSLAELHSLVKSFQEAIGAANKALAIFEDLGDQKGEARACHCLADARFRSGQMEGGNKAAEDAIALWQELGNQRQEANEYLTIARWSLEEDLGQEAVEAAQKALAIVEELNDVNRIVAATKYLVRGYSQSKQAEEAVKLADEAAERWRSAGNTKLELEMMELQTNNFLDLEDPDSALPVAEAAVRLARRAGDRRAEGAALEVLAQVQQAKEDFVEALAAAKEAIALFRDMGDTVGEASARHAAVSAYIGRKKLGEALDEARKARELFRKAGQRHDEGRALLVKSCAHKMGSEFGEAVQDATEAQYLFQKEKDRRWESKALHDVAELQAMRENFPAALRAAKKAEALVQETGDITNIAAVLSTVAQIYLSSMVGEISKAPKEDPDIAVVEETIQASWRAREAARLAYEKNATEQTKSLLGPIEYLLAQGFLAIRDGEQASVHIEEGEKICNEFEDETGKVIGWILRAYVGILSQDMQTAKKEAEKADKKSREINYEFGVQLCEGIFELVESSKDESGGIPTGGPPMALMPSMPDQPAYGGGGQRRPMPQQRAPGGPGPAPVAAVSAAAPAAPSKPTIEPEMVKVQVMEVAQSLIGDDSLVADTPLMDAGLDSLSMVEFRNELLKEFPGVSLPGALLFDYPTINALRDYIFEAMTNG